MGQQFNVTEITTKLFDKAELMGYMLSPDSFTDEGVAEENGFYWVDEIDRWANIDGVKDLYIKGNY